MSRQSLLIIDRGQIIMDVSKRIFERSGYVVSCAVGIDDAREKLKDFSPDAIILNKNLPDGSGLDRLGELCAEYKKPVLFVSDNKEDEVAAFNMGATEFLSQPYNYDVLETRIRLMLSRNGSADGLQRADEPERGSADLMELNPSSSTALFPMPVDNTPPSPATRVNLLRVDSSEPDDTAMLLEAAQDTKSENTELELANVKRKSQSGISRNLVVTCAMIIIAGAGLYTLVRGLSEEAAVFDEKAPPLGDTIFQTSISSADNGIGQIITVPGIDNVVISSGTTDLDIMLFNSEDNYCCLVFEIVLRDAGITLYTSEKLAPGETADKVAISGDLPVGEHCAVLLIHTYSSNGKAKDERVGSISVDFSITVY